MIGLASYWGAYSAFSPIINISVFLVRLPIKYTMLSMLQSSLRLRSPLCLLP